MSDPAQPLSRHNRRVTVWHGQYLADAQENHKSEDRRYPDAEVTVSGQPGHWLVRRDWRPGDDERRPPNSHCQHRICKALREKEADPLAC